MLEKKVDFIDIDPGVPAQCPVADHPVKHAVQHHQHPHRKKLLAQISDVIAQDTGVRVHVGGLGKGVEAALGEQLDCQGANSEFLVMLNQAATDRAELARLLNISDNQLSYITNVDFGRGLIKCGSAIVPFMDNFPKNRLYRLMSTKLSETNVA